MQRELFCSPEGARRIIGVQEGVICSREGARRGPGVQEGLFCTRKGALRRFGEHKRVVLHTGRAHGCGRWKAGNWRWKAGGGQGEALHREGGTSQGGRRFPGEGHATRGTKAGGPLRRGGGASPQDEPPKTPARRGEEIAGIKAVFCRRELKEVSIFCILALI